MAEVKFKGHTVRTAGNLPTTGAPAPNFKLTRRDLTDATLADYRGKKVIMNVAQSLDTGTCANATRQFNETATKLDNTVVVTVSADLPFAQARFCETNGIENVEVLSNFRDPTFGREWGMLAVEGPIRGLLARAVIVLDEEGIVRYTQQVPETSLEPDYDSVINAVKKM